MISRKNAGYTIEDIQQSTIAIPGINTTANLLLSFAFPDANKKQPILFSDIEDAVLSGKTDLGVIIHENRFTYQEKGLYKVIDLGEYWEQKMKIPVPLGGIAMKKTFQISTIEKINNLIKESLDYAFSNYPHIAEYVKQHSQEMSENVMRQHIDLYVNNFSLDLGTQGKRAIEALRRVYEKK